MAVLPNNHRLNCCRDRRHCHYCLHDSTPYISEYHWRTPHRPFADLLSLHFYSTTLCLRYLRKYIFTTACSHCERNSQWSSNATLLKCGANASALKSSDGQLWAERIVPYTSMSIKVGAKRVIMCDSNSNKLQSHRTIPLVLCVRYYSPRRSTLSTSLRSTITVGKRAPHSNINAV